VKSYVADTHALFWYLTASPRLGTAAKKAFDESARGEARVLIPVIVLAELHFLNEKASKPLAFADEFERLRQAGQFTLLPFEPEHVADFDRDVSIPEMHDRIIVGAARRAGATLLTRDAAVTASAAVPVAW
jgi:PIN domain nuclease of toxin-antitoxin system